MRVDIDKQVFDWSKGQNLRVKARGTMALFNQAARVLPNLNIVKISSRSEWPLQQNNSRYLTRKIWVS